MAQEGELTAYSLQDALVAFIEESLSGMTFDAEGSGSPEAMNVYRQALPIKIHKDEDPVDEEDISQEYEEDEEETTDDRPCPWTVVKLLHGSIADPDCTYRVAADIIIGIYDKGSDNHGILRILETIERIQLDLIKKRLIGSAWRLAYGQDNTPMIQWALSEEDTYPYFYGGISIVCEGTPPQSEAGKEYL